jgi:hypothetical protein
MERMSFGILFLAWGAAADESCVMTGDDYRQKAIELMARARTAPNGQVQSELEALSLSYLRLAEQAERNSHMLSASTADGSVEQQSQDPEVKKASGLG